jgi:myo-inositol catabolism protein IolC
MPRGYDRPLYILPFDHRYSFQTKMFGWQSPLSDEQTAEIAGAKRVIYDGFLAAHAGGVPREKAGILVDEQFGAAILRDATSKNIVTVCPLEKSGQAEFEFEYGEEFASHIEAFDPIFAKVLVRYNPDADRALNKRQAARLKRLSDFLAARGRSRFMFELLVPPEKMQLDRLKGNRETYDLELRPRLMIEAIQELRATASIRICGRSKASRGARIASASWRRHAPVGAITSAASFSGAGRTIGRSVSGSKSQQVCLGSLDLQSPARFPGIRWSAGGANGRRAIRPSPRSASAIVSLWICSSGKM